MARMVEGSEALARKLAALKKEVPEALKPVLVKAGEEVAADAAPWPRLSGAPAGRLKASSAWFTRYVLAE